MNILVDWFTVSVKSMKLEKLISILKLPVDDCRLTGSRWAGRYPVEKCMSFGGIEVHFGEYLILNISGGGCRLLESLYDNVFNWIDFIEQFLCLEGSHMSRLDVACDDYPQDGEKAILSFKTLLRHQMQKRYVSISNKASWTGGDRKVLIFGSEQSERLLRIYDKALERKIEGHWIRAEFQLRNEAALSFYIRALECGSIGQAYQGMLFDYLRFTKEVNKQDHNQKRLTVTRWWRTFCGNAKRIKGFYVGGLEYNLESLERYLGNQTSSSIKTYLAAHSGDATGLFEMAETATYNKKQEFLLKTQPLIEKMQEDYDFKKAVGDNPRILTRTESLALYKASEEQRQYEERYKHWVPLGCSLDAQKVYEESTGKLMSDIAAEDLPFD